MAQSVRRPILRICAWTSRVIIHEENIRSAVGNPGVKRMIIIVAVVVTVIINNSCSSSNEYQQYNIMQPSGFCHTLAGLAKLNKLIAFKNLWHTNTVGL